MPESCVSSIHAPTIPRAAANRLREDQGLATSSRVVFKDKSVAASEEALRSIDGAGREGVRVVNAAGYILSYLSDPAADPAVAPDAIALLRECLGLLSDQFSLIVHAAGDARRRNVLRASAIVAGHYDRFLTVPSFAASDLFFGEFGPTEDAWARELEARRQTREKVNKPSKGPQRSRYTRQAPLRRSQATPHPPSFLSLFKAPVAPVQPARLPRYAAAAPSQGRQRRGRRGGYRS